jgi:hypothetical protein
MCKFNSGFEKQLTPGNRMNEVKTEKDEQKEEGIGPMRQPWVNASILLAMQPGLEFTEHFRFELYHTKLQMMNEVVRIAPRISDDPTPLVEVIVNVVVPCAVKDNTILTGAAKMLRALIDEDQLIPYVEELREEAAMDAKENWTTVLEMLKGK